MSRFGKSSRVGRPRPKAVGYGCYPPDSDPDPEDADRDSKALDKEREAEERRESEGLLKRIKRASGGAASVGRWEPIS